MDAPATDGRPGGRRGILVLALQLGLTVLVAWFILDRVGVSLADLGRVDPERWTPRWLPFLGSCAVLGAGFVMSGLVWGRMVRDMGGPRVRPAAAVRIYFVSNLGRYIPGKLWQIAGLALLAREEGVPARIATGAAVLGQGIALVAAALVGTGALLEAGPRLRSAGLWALGALALLCLVALAPPVLRRLTTLWFRIARAEPPGGEETGPALVLRWGGLYLVNWCVYAVSFWILVRSFDLPGTPLQVAPAFAAAYVLGYVAVFAPAGLGVREGFLTAFLGPVMGAATAATLAIVARLWITGVEVVPAGAFWLVRLGGGSDASPGPGPGEGRP